MAIEARSAGRRSGHQMAFLGMPSSPLELCTLGLVSLVCLGGAVLNAVVTKGVAVRMLVSLALVLVAIKAYVYLRQKMDFRLKRLQTGSCGHRLCHGVVQRTPTLPREQVICPTCKRVWPKVEGMEFKLTQRTGAAPVRSVRSHG